MGAGFGDLDNDGWLDVYLTTGEPDYLSLMPNAMFRNDGGKMFQDVTSSGGFGNLQKGHGVSFADIDNDGHQDIYHQQGGAYPGDKYQNALYHNPGRDANFLYVTLRGVTSNRAGVGARIKAVIEEDGETRALHRAVGTYTSFGANPMRIELGIGQAERVTSLEVSWPASDHKDVFRDIPANTWIAVTEDSDAYEVRSLERLTFPPEGGVDRTPLKTAQTTRD
jgi:hypothetical protein